MEFDMLLSSFKNFENTLELIKASTKQWIITDEDFPIFIESHRKEMLKQTLVFLLNEKTKSLNELIDINEIFMDCMKKNIKDEFYDEKKKTMDNKIKTLNESIENIRNYISR
jgi:hypothetical protein